MPSLVNGEKAKGKINRQRHSFKLRVYGTGNGYFFINQFQLVSYKSKVWRIKVTGSEAPPECIIIVLRYFFDLITVHEHLSLAGVSAFSDPFLRIYIIRDRICLHFILSLH